MDKTFYHSSDPMIHQYLTIVIFGSTISTTTPLAEMKS